MLNCFNLYAGLQTRFRAPDYDYYHEMLFRLHKEKDELATHVLPLALYSLILYEKVPV